MRDRNHLYLFTVETRKVSQTETGKVTTWEEKQVEAYNIGQAAVKLGLPIDDIRFVTKAIIQ